MNDVLIREQAGSLAAGADPALALAHWAAALEFADIPTELRTLLSSCVLDLVGVACAGHAADTTPGVLAGITRLAGRATGDGCVVIGSDLRLPAQYAALLNGTLAHSLELDDTNSGRGGHPGAAIVPAALAGAEQAGCDGPTLLAGLLAGYEVAARVGAALGRTAYARGFHPTAIAGTFGAVAAHGRITGQPATVIADAFGLAGSLVAGSRQYIANGASNKRLHPGFAAHHALLALALAEAGVSGASHSLDGRFGVLAGYCSSPDESCLTDGLGTQFLTRGVSFKPHAAPRMAHSSLDAALAHRSALGPGGDPFRIEAVRVELSPSAFALLGDPARLARPDNSVAAQFNLRFLLAAALANGPITWSSYRLVDDEQVWSLARRVEIVEDGGRPDLAARVSVTVGGRTTDRTVDVPMGEASNPMSPDRLREKFRSCAGTRLTAGSMDRIERVTAQLGSASAAEVAGLLVLIGARPHTACSNPLPAPAGRVAQPTASRNGPNT